MVKADKSSLLPFVLGLAALILVIVSMFTSWWVLKASAGGASDETAASPFDQGDFSSDNDQDDLAGETLTAGLLVVGAIVAILGFVGLSIMGMMGRSLHPMLPVLALIMCIFFGLTATILAWTTWPSGHEGTDRLGLGFWDSSEFGGARFSTYAGAGWYIGIVGMVLVPGAAAAFEMRRPKGTSQSIAMAGPMVAPAPISPPRVVSSSPAYSPRRNLDTPEETPALDRLSSRPVRKTARAASPAKAKKAPAKKSKK